MLTPPPNNFPKDQARLIDWIIAQVQSNKSGQSTLETNTKYVASQVETSLKRASQITSDLADTRIIAGTAAAGIPEIQDGLRDVELNMHRAGRVAAAVIGITVTGNVGTWAKDGRAVSTVSLEWTPVTTAVVIDEDGPRDPDDPDSPPIESIDPHIDVAGYEIWSRFPHETLRRDTRVMGVEATVDTWEPGIERIVQIRAVSKDGVPGLWSDEVFITPTMPLSNIPKTPAGVTVTSNVGEFTNTGPRATIGLSWSAVAESVEGAPLTGVSYRVYVDGALRVEVATLTTSISVPSQVSAEIRVTAVMDGLESDRSPIVSVTGALPAAFSLTPSAPVLSSSHGNVRAVWDGEYTSAAPAGAHTVRVEARVGSGAWVYQGSALTSAGEQLVSIGAIGDTVEVRFTAFDQLQRPTGTSATASIEVKGVRNGDLDEALQQAVQEGRDAKDAAVAAMDKALEAEGGVSGALQAVQDLEDELDPRITTAQQGANAAAQDALAAVNAAEEAQTVAGNAQTVADQAAADALAAANAVSAAQDAADAAQTTADGKGKVIIQPGAPSAADRLPQNLWIDTTGGNNTPKRWDGSDWVVVTDKAATDAAAAAVTAQDRADEAYNEALSAATAAGNAQTSADGKTTNWYQNDAPAGTAHKVGDTWFDTNDGNRIYRWNGSWVAAQLGTNAISDTAINAAKLAANAVTEGKILNGAITNDKLSTAVKNSITTAQSTADNAATIASNAQSVASSAQTAASNAQTDATQAISDAAAAAGIAGGKADVLIQNTAPPAAMRKATTLWIDTTGGANTPKRWVSGTTWTAVTDKAATDAAAAAATAQSAASAAQSRADDAHTVASGAQTAASAAASAASAAQTAANNAQTTANGKNKIVRSTNNASSPGNYIAGDQWWKYSGSQITAMWIHSGSAWVSQTLTDSVITNLNAGSITAGTISADRLSATNIKSVLINAGAIQTANIAAGAITAASGIIADAAIGTAKIIDGSITTAKIKDLAVTNAEIANGTIQHAKIGSVDASKISVGTLDAARIAANSITTEKLMVGDFTNLFNSTYFRTGSGAVELSGGASAYTGSEVSPTGGHLVSIGSRDHYATVGQRVTAKPGEEFYVEVVAKQVAGTAVLNTKVAAWTQSGGTPSGMSGTWNTTTFNSGTVDLGNGWVRRWAYVKIPDNAVDVAFTGLYLQIAQNTPYTTTWLFTNPVVRRRTTGELIVDGSITGDKVNATSVAAKIGEFIEVRASNIVGDTAALNQAFIGQLVSDNGFVNSLYANRVLVTPEELAPGPGGFDDVYNVIRGTIVHPTTAFAGTQNGQGVFRFNGGTSSSGEARGPIMPVKAGQKYRIEAFISWYGSSTTGGYTELRAEWFNDPGETRLSYSIAARREDTTGGALHGGTVTAPADARYGRFYIYTPNQSGAGDVAVFNISFKPQVGSVLIEDGAVKAAKMDADEIYADEAHMNVLSAGLASFDEITGLGNSLNITANQSIELAVGRQDATDEQLSGLREDVDSTAGAAAQAAIVADEASIAAEAAGKELVAHNSRLLDVESGLSDQQAHFKILEGGVQVAFDDGSASLDMTPESIQFISQGTPVAEITSEAIIIYEGVFEQARIGNHLMQKKGNRTTFTPIEGS